MNRLQQILAEQFRQMWRLNDDAAPEEEVICGIEAGVQFRGAKLWILIFAIFTASLGLNTNSTAVIIGAMLISPLMGPILGIGLGVGINDFDLLKRSWKNFLIATLVSVLTATCYFLITPMAEAKSELLARTSPTIYDVLIALMGGLAGIIALGSRTQRMGNVIPGVAIATALMPPLCTVGFGLATANWSFAAGALYLYIINSIFIALATFIGAAFIMRFQKRRLVDKAREHKVKRIVTTLAIVTLTPALILTVGMVQESWFNRHVNDFVHQELHFPRTAIVSRHTSFDTRSFDVVLIGAEVDSTLIAQARERLPLYGLEGVSMQVMQATDGLEDGRTQEEILAYTENELEQSELLLAQQQLHINELEHSLRPYQEAEALAPALLDELMTLFPQVQSLTIAHGTKAANDSTSTQSPVSLSLYLIDVENALTKADSEKIEAWIKKRTGDEGAVVIFDI